MTRTAMLSALLVCTLSLPAWADAAPRPVRPTPSAVPTPPTDPQCQMTDANVIVKLKYTPTTRPAANPRANRPGGNGDIRVGPGGMVFSTSRRPAPPPATAPEDFVTADVACDFDLTCEKAKDGGEPMEIWFPVCYNVLGPKMTRFDVAIDGKAATDVRHDDEQTWSPGDKGYPVYYAYRWMSSAVAGKTQKLKVTYSMRLPVRDGQAEFMYVIVSGGAWAKPIKHETVTVTGEGVTVTAAPSRTLKPETAADGSLVWTLTNAVPAEDVHVNIVPKPTP